jgi:hypothetical protein
MLILFDQGTPVGIRDSLPGHIVKTAHQQGWSTLLNGELLRVAEEAGFDVLLTTDKDPAYQQNLAQRKIAIVALGRNRWSLIQPALQRIADGVNAARLGSYRCQSHLFGWSSGPQPGVQCFAVLSQLCKFMTKNGPLGHSLWYL